MAKARTGKAVKPAIGGGTAVKQAPGGWVLLQAGEVLHDRDTGGQRVEWAGRSDDHRGQVGQRIQGQPGQVGAVGIAVVGLSR